jgi:serine/threonine protein kinase/tetratricopeptide (TPR) repeat protein
MPPSPGWRLERVVACSRVGTGIRICVSFRFAMGNLVGRSLAHFRIVEKLGEGGMGVVYKATDENLRRTVALKVLPDSLSNDEDRRRRFLREARSAAAVTHANIATVYDSGEADGHVFIAMELVEGETLRARLEKEMSIAEAVRIAKDIARGLARAHEKGIIHRDLKPENLMITRHGEVKILDFGLAKAHEEQPPTASALEKADTETNLTREGKLLGTPGYMSPEQARGQEVDARTDVFAFGVVLYEMVTGERPFVGETTQDVLTAVMRDTPTRASAVNPLASVEIDRVIERCLEKMRDARYANGQELSDAFHTVSPKPSVSELSAQKPPAPTVSLLTPAASTVAARGTRRRQWGFVGIAGLGIVGLALGYRARGTRLDPPGPVDAASVSVSATAPVPSVTTLANLPPLATKIPEAGTEYAAGMQALHDNSGALATAHFRRTVELDPSLAIAHLRLSMQLFWYDATLKREEFAKAAALRAQLSPRDQSLLEALEPVLQRARLDRAEAALRIERAIVRYPLDVEFLDWFGTLKFGEPKSALPLTERAIKLDPDDGVAWQNQGESLRNLGRNEEARASFEHCAGLTVDSTDCLVSLSYLDDSEGRCGAREIDARRQFDRDPSGAAQQLAAAMLALKRPEAAVLDVLEQGEARVPDPARRAILQMLHRVPLAIQAADFSRVEELSRQSLAAAPLTPATRTDFGLQFEAAYHVLRALQEMGREKEASKFANDFLARSENWSTNYDSDDLLLVFMRYAIGPGAASMEEFERRRAEWIEERAGTYPGEIWKLAYAGTALTPDDARDALAALPRFAPSVAGYEAYSGHVYLLAGRAGEAIPYLRRATAVCEASFQIVGTRASLWLGEALEATNDTRGACAAYKLVLDRWGHAKPRSVTADAARVRTKALACPQ